MGLGGISLTQLVVILIIVLVVFGTKRVKSLGSDLGGAINGFRRAMYADADQDKGDAGYATQPRLIASEEDTAPAAELSERASEAKRVDRARSTRHG